MKKLITAIAMAAMLALTASAALANEETPAPDLPSASAQMCVKLDVDYVAKIDVPRFLRLAITQENFQPWDIVPVKWFANFPYKVIVESGKCNDNDAVEAQGYKYGLPTDLYVKLDHGKPVSLDCPVTIAYGKGGFGYKKLPMGLSPRDLGSIAAGKYFGKVCFTIMPKDCGENNDAV